MGLVGMMSLMPPGFHEIFGERSEATFEKRMKIPEGMRSADEALKRGNANIKAINGKPNEGLAGRLYRESHSFTTEILFNLTTAYFDSHGQRANASGNMPERGAESHRPRHPP